MGITIEDIKKEYLSRFGGSSSASQSEPVDTTKLANDLRVMSEYRVSDNLPALYLSMIKEAREKAKNRLGLGDRLSLR